MATVTVLLSDAETLVGVFSQKLKLWQTLEPLVAAETLVIASDGHDPVPCTYANLCRRLRETSQLWLMPPELAPDPHRPFCPLHWRFKIWQVAVNTTTNIDQESML